MARTDKQNEQMRDVRKEKIRAAALNLFSKNGLCATKISDIAEEAEMAQGLLYHYYPSKDAIYADLINDAFDKINEASLYLRDMDASAKKKLLFSLRELFKTIESSDSFRQTCRLISQAMNSMAIPESIKKKQDIPYLAISEVMRQGQHEGSIVNGDPNALAVLYWASVNGLSIYYSTRDNAIAPPDYRVVASMFLREKLFVEE